MLLTVFVCFIVLAFALIVIGQTISNPSFQVAGSVFLFVLGVVLMFGGVNHQTGYEDTLVYGGNFTSSVHWDEAHPSEYPSFNLSEDPIYLFHSQRIYVYSPLESTEIVGGINVEHLIGLLLAVMGISCFVGVMMSLGRFNL